MTRILLVEDDNEIRELLCSFLTDKGYETETAVDGMVGLKKALDEEKTDTKPSAKKEIVDITDWK